MVTGIKAVIWDMGGVIFRTEDETSKAALAEKYGLTLEELYRLVFASDSANLATLGLVNEAQHWQTIGARFNIDGNELDSFQEKFWDGDIVDRELIAFIGSLKEKYITGLLSNAWSGARSVLTDHYRCMDVFTYSTFSCELGLAKPDPAIYIKFLELLNVQPPEAIFVDDLQKNIDAANALGIHGIRFRDPRQAKQDVLALLTQ